MIAQSEPERERSLTPGKAGSARQGATKRLGWAENQHLVDFYVASPLVLRFDQFVTRFEPARHFKPFAFTRGSRVHVD